MSNQANEQKKRNDQLKRATQRQARSLAFVAAHNKKLQRQVEALQECREFVESFTATQLRGEPLPPNVVRANEIIDKLESQATSDWLPEARQKLLVSAVRRLLSQIDDNSWLTRSRDGVFRYAVNLRDLITPREELEQLTDYASWRAATAVPADGSTLSEEPYDEDDYRGADFS